ncbi:hypothetical protein V5799_013182 [Amblyomma americanum]|uniref:Uncharacterized protein n=1 Tax=Amblyomma americanum TaxID=6943 RepID=A0AAQ4E6R5_AMBAM
MGASQLQRDEPGFEDLSFSSNEDWRRLSSLRMLKGSPLLGSSSKASMMAVDNGKTSEMLSSLQNGFWRWLQRSTQERVADLTLALLQTSNVTTSMTTPQVVHLFAEISLRYGLPAVVSFDGAYPSCPQPSTPEAQPGPAIVKSAPFVSLSKGMTKLYEGGWTQCVLYMLGLLCMVVAVAFIVIVYLFLAEMQGDEIRTPAKQRDDTHCHSAPPLTGSLSRSTSDASLDVVGENVTLAETSVTHGQSFTLAQ